MVEIEIDNKKISVPEGSTIIEAADQENIDIPRFCYHKKLSVAANCRMCLVEVEKINKPLPACATPVTPGMKVKTRSKMSLEAQQAVMEYLLINHPLDCPICDQGGECELQDLTMGYAKDHSNYNQPKRSVVDENLGPLIETCMTRCIQCTRCVRFGEEIAGMRELGVLNRTEEERIGTYVKHLMQSELSGNIIDLCPVGALVSKPFRFTGRAWEMRETPMIAPHDALGTHIYVHSRGQEYSPVREVMRVVPRENPAINQTWITDRDRFSYLGLSHIDRVLAPRIKRAGQWYDISWPEALQICKDRLQEVLSEHGPEQLAGLVSPQSTLEECYLFQKWLRKLGCCNIDHRLRQQDCSDQHTWPLYPGLGMSLTELSQSKAVLLIGANLRHGQPLLTQRLFQASKNGMVIMNIAFYDFSYPFNCSSQCITHDLVQSLEQIVMMIRVQNKTAEVNASNYSQAIVEIVNQLITHGSQASLILGDEALNHPESSRIRQLLGLIAKYTGAKIAMVTEGANSAGAWLAGAVPHRGSMGTKIEAPGLSAYTVFNEQKQKAYVLLGVEPEYDMSYSAAAVSALKQADFVLCLNSFITESMQDYADMILPIAPFTETPGTYVNMMGDWQSFEAVTVPQEQVKPAWRIVCRLAETMGIAGFSFKDINLVQQEINHLREKELGTQSLDEVARASCLQISDVVLKEVELKLDACNINASIDINHDQPKTRLLRYAPWPIYRVDGLCRRALALQEVSQFQNLSQVIVHPKTAARLQFNSGDLISVKQEEQTLTLPIAVSDAVAVNMVVLSSGLEETQGFGQAFDEIILEKR